MATKEKYHLFNRSVGSEEILSNKRYLKKSLEIIDYYRFSQKLKLSAFKNLPEHLKKDYLTFTNNQRPLVGIYSFALMPNHYHLQVEQNQDDGIVKFISNFQNSFAKYFNIKNNRQGALFQNAFKAKRITTEEEFIHVSRYIHLNPVTSYFIEFEDLADYPWTSFQCYTNKQKSFVNTKLLIKKFGSTDKYVDFVGNQVDYQRKLNQIKHLTIE